MKPGILLALAVAAFPPAAQAADVRVAIYSQHPVSQMTLRPQNGAFLLKMCRACPAREHTQPVSISAESGSLRVNGEKTKRALLVATGSYRMEASPNAPLSTGFPVEITAQATQLQIVLTMPIEDYVAAVLAGEAKGMQSQGALEAMAIAVRSYATHYRGRHLKQNFDFCDTTHCQDVHLNAIDDRILAAVEVTEGELLWYRGTPAAAYYHQQCGGTTAAAHEVWPGQALPYLQEHPDPYCTRQSSGGWQTRIPFSEMREALRASSLEASSWSHLIVASRWPSGRVRELRVESDSGATSKLASSTLRFSVGRALGWNRIRSDLYELREDGDSIVFTGRGSGHGVGLCQLGADEMGRQGKSARDILSFYYPGTLAGVTAQGLPWEVHSSERVEILTAGDFSPEIARTIERNLAEAERDVGWLLPFPPRLKLFPSVATYRDSTGEPGWVAASTRGHVIRLQPVRKIESRGTLNSVLRHEFLHLLVEARARPGLPVWFREGLVLYLAGGARQQASALSTAQMENSFRNSQERSEMERAYATAGAEVAKLARDHGRAVVLGWLSHGLPAGAGDDAISAGPAQHGQHR